MWRVSLFRVCVCIFLRQQLSPRVIIYRFYAHFLSVSFLTFFLSFTQACIRARMCVCFCMCQFRIIFIWIRMISFGIPFMCSEMVDDMRSAPAPPGDNNNKLKSSKWSQCRLSGLFFRNKNGELSHIGAYITLWTVHTVNFKKEAALVQINQINVQVWALQHVLLFLSVAFPLARTALCFPHSFPQVSISIALWHVVICPFCVRNMIQTFLARARAFVRMRCRAHIHIIEMPNSRCHITKNVCSYFLGVFFWSFSCHTFALNRCLLSVTISY